MPLVPTILELGTGVDLHGQNYTEAARRAVWDAVHHGSLMYLGLFGPNTASEMIVEVTLAIPEPDKVDDAVVLAALPHGKGVLKKIKGGLEIDPRGGSGDKTVMANAAIVVKINRD
jgi:uncharacterized protein (TIGR02058 family)